MSAIFLAEKVVHYEVLGRGRPILFLHGWVGSWRYWVPAMQTAAVSFRTYALDLWGFGDTARVPENYVLEGQLSLIDKFTQSMGIGRVAIIGHGYGALLAVLFARDFPALVDRVMAVSLPLEAGNINTRLRDPSSPGDLADWLVGKGPLAEPARMDAPKADPLAISASFASPGSYNLLPILDAFTTSCLLVYGQNDPAVQIPDYERLLVTPEMVHHVVFEGSAHFPMLDDGPAFNRLMTDFLALDSGESPRDLQLKDEWKRRIR